MSSIEEGLNKKKAEIEEVEADIKRIQDEREKLREFHKSFETKGQIINDLKKTKKRLQKEFNTVISFFKKVDSHYLDNVYPLFSNNENETGTDKAEVA